MKRNSPDDAYSLILNEILSGSLKPREIVTEVSLAQKYGISRTPVREALGRLQCEGLISSGNRTKRVYSLSKQDILEIFELKELIEGRAADNAARKIDTAQSAEMKKIVSEMHKLDKIGPENEEEARKFLEEWLSLDRQFHSLLFTVSGNERARQTIEKINLQWHRFKVGIAAMEGRIGYAIPEHESIAAAIIAHDAKRASKEMVSHLENLKNYIIRLMSIFG